jgi:hypothetical protein
METTKVMKTATEESNRFIDSDYSLNENQEAYAAPGDTAALGRKVIFNYTYQLDTKDMAETLEKLNNAVTACGGYVINANYGTGSSGDQFNYANIVYRVPVGQTSYFKDEVQKAGRVRSMSENGEDVTDQYFDTETRLSTLTLQEKRLLDLLEKSGTLADVIEIERELANVRTNIEMLTGTLKKYDNLVALATFTVNINNAGDTAPMAEPVFSESVFRALGNSASYALDVARFVLFALIYLLPYLILALIAFLIIRRFRRNSKNSKKERKKGRNGGYSGNDGNGGYGGNDAAGKWLYDRMSKTGSGDGAGQPGQDAGPSQTVQDAGSSSSRDGL